MISHADILLQDNKALHKKEQLDDRDVNRIREKVISLPLYSCYESSRESFIEDVKAGKIWIAQPLGYEGRIIYLCIRGDGGHGKRIFVLHENGDLFLIEKEDEVDKPKGEPAYPYIKKYNPKTKRFDYIATIYDSDLILE